MSDAGRVALTFDAEHPDRPGCRSGNADRILDALAAAEVRATFFVQGRWAEAYPATASRIARDGHLIAHHSHYHARMPLLTNEGLAADIHAAAAAILAATGMDPRPWFRMPFGAGRYDPRVLGVLDELGYTNVHWDVDVKDWEPWRTRAAISADAVTAIADRVDTVLLLHTWPDGTAEATADIVRSIAEGGRRFVTVDELEVGS